MPRKLRRQYPGAMDHLMNRGDQREDVFGDITDRQCFLATLGEACEKTDWQVHAYWKGPTIDNLHRRGIGYSSRRAFHRFKRFGTPGTLGTLWDGAGTLAKVRIARVYRAWDGGTAVYPQDTPAP